MFDPIKLFKDIATLKGYKFIYGTMAHMNWHITQETLTAGQTFLGALPIIENIETPEGQPDMSLYETKLYVGRKFDPLASTVSSLDETYDQKYTRRLKALTVDLKSVLHELFCHSANIEVTRSRIVHDINQFDENCDTVVCELSFRVDYQYTN